MDFYGLVKITKANLRHNFLTHFSVAVFIALLTPLFFDISGIDKNMAAQPIEIMLSLIGIVLITPSFLPEQSENIRDVIRSKRMNYVLVYGIRLLYSSVAIILIVGLFITFMFFSDSAVTITHFIGGVISAFFLGTLGFAASGFSGNIYAGYMVPVLYYIANIAGKEKLGNFFLFSMMRGSFEEKYFLLCTSVILVVGTLGGTAFINKKR